MATNGLGSFASMDDAATFTALASLDDDTQV
jgi:hypothetical protein